jgi:hypothetical protein
MIGESAKSAGRLAIEGHHASINFGDYATAD